MDGIGINYKQMDPQKVEKMLADGKVHLDSVCSLYRRQLRQGKYFLHEHPATALSWKEDQVLEIARQPNVQIVTADQCEYGLVTPSADDKTKMLPAMKPTKWATASDEVACHMAWSYG